MSAEVHASLVGGAIGGGVVLLGILLTDWFHRRSRDRQTIEAATHELVIRLPFVVMGLSDQRPDGFQMDMGSTWWQERERTLRAMNEIRASARARRHKRIREAVNDLGARIAAAEIRSGKGKLLTMSTVYEMMDHDLYGLVFPHTKGVEKLTEKYLEREA